MKPAAGLHAACRSSVPLCHPAASSEAGLMLGTAMRMLDQAFERTVSA